MCGFVGFIDENDQTYDHRAAIIAMADAIAHRGPDSEGYFNDGRTALGFRRLAIIDLAGANQPLFNENRSLVLVFNGEIYNYRELRRQLIAAGHAFSTQGDAEVVLHGFEQWGEGVLDRLRGMFAFALYDTATGELFCAGTPSASSRSTTPWKAAASCSARRSRGFSRTRTHAGA